MNGDSETLLTGFNCAFIATTPFFAFSRRMMFHQFSYNNARMEKNNMQLGHGIESELLFYPNPLLKACERGDYSFLVESKASDFIKDILVSKAKRRPGRRFFGEAFIATKMEMKDGWYGSFKWLTSKKWLTGDGLNSRRERLFFEALMKHIGPKMLLRLQKEAKISWKETNGNIVKPVAPDLWIIAQTGEFRFIESKMPWDTLRPGQIAGLKLIKKYLRVNAPVRVFIVNLQPKGM